MNPDPLALWKSDEKYEVQFEEVAHNKMTRTKNLVASLNDALFSWSFFMEEQLQSIQ